MKFLLICVIIFLLYIIFLKSQKKEIIEILSKKDTKKILVDYGLVNLCNLAINEIENDNIKKNENPQSALIICKKISTSSEYENIESLIFSLKTILQESTLTSRYLLEIRFYLN